MNTNNNYIECKSKHNEYSIRILYYYECGNEWKENNQHEGNKKYNYRGNQDTAIVQSKNCNQENNIPS